MTRRVEFSIEFTTFLVLLSLEDSYCRSCIQGPVSIFSRNVNM